MHKASSDQEHTRDAVAHDRRSGTKPGGREKGAFIRPCDMRSELESAPKRLSSDPNSERQAEGSGCGCLSGESGTTDESRASPAAACASGLVANHSSEIGVPLSTAVRPAATRPTRPVRGSPLRTSLPATAWAEADAAIWHVRQVGYGCTHTKDE